MIMRFHRAIAVLVAGCLVAPDAGAISEFCSLSLPAGRQGSVFIKSNLNSELRKTFTDQAVVPPSYTAKAFPRAGIKSRREARGYLFAETKWTYAILPFVKWWKAGRVADSIFYDLLPEFPSFFFRNLNGNMDGVLGVFKESSKAIEDSDPAFWRLLGNHLRKRWGGFWRRRFGPINPYLAICNVATDEDLQHFRANEQKILAVLEGGDAEERVTGCWSKIVSLAIHLRYHLLHCEPEESPEARPLDNELLVTWGRRFIPLVLALPEYQARKAPEVTEGFSIQPRLTTKDLVLWALTMLIDPSLHRVEGEARFDATNKAVFRNGGDRQAIKEMFLGNGTHQGLLTDLYQVDKRGRPTRQKILPEAIEHLLAGALSRTDEEWQTLGLRSPWGVGADQCFIERFFDGIIRRCPRPGFKLRVFDLALSSTPYAELNWKKQKFPYSHLEYAREVFLSWPEFRNAFPHLPGLLHTADPKPLLEQAIIAPSYITKALPHACIVTSRIIAARGELTRRGGSRNVSFEEAAGAFEELLDRREEILSLTFGGTPSRWSWQIRKRLDQFMHNLWSGKGPITQKLPTFSLTLQVLKREAMRNGFEEAGPGTPYPYILSNGYAASIKDWRNIFKHPKKIQAEVERAGRIMLDYFIFVKLTQLVFLIRKKSPDRIREREARWYVLLERLQSGIGSSGQAILRDGAYLYSLGKSAFCWLAEVYLEDSRRAHRDFDENQEVRYRLSRARLNGLHLLAQRSDQYQFNFPGLWSRPVIRVQNDVDYLSRIDDMSFLLGFYDRNIHSGKMNDGLRREIAETILIVIASDPPFFTQQGMFSETLAIIRTQGKILRHRPDKYQNRFHQPEVAATYFRLLREAGPNLLVDWEALHPDVVDYSPLGCFLFFPFQFIEMMLLLSILDPSFESFSLDDALSSGGSALKKSWAKAWGGLWLIATTPLEHPQSYQHGYARRNFQGAESALRSFLKDTVFEGNRNIGSSS